MGANDNISFVKTSVFSQNVDTIVNTVNCVGVMGKGLALEFKIRYPIMFEDYVARCNNNEVKPGIPYLYKNSNIKILNFPTKNHWRDPSKVEWIRSGLNYFIEKYKEWDINSIAFPKLGSSLGGLNFEKEVRPIMKELLDGLDIKIFICLDEEPDEKEKEMIQFVRQLGLSKYIKSQKYQNSIDLNNYNILRFRDLLEFEGISSKNYAKILWDSLNHVDMSNKEILETLEKNAKSLSDKKTRKKKNKKNKRKIDKGNIQNLDNFFN